MQKSEFTGCVHKVQGNAQNHAKILCSGSTTLSRHEKENDAFRLAHPRIAEAWPASKNGGNSPWPPGLPFSPAAISDRFSFHSPGRYSVSRLFQFRRALTLAAASCTMNWVRALSSAVRAFGLHPKGRPFKSDSAHHCDATPFSGDVVQLVRALPCRWLESHTVTAEPQNQLSHRASNDLECQPCLSI